MKKRSRLKKIPTKLIILSDQSCFEVMTKEGAEQIMMMRITSKVK